MGPPYHKTERPFTIECVACDAGQSVSSWQDAINDGWSDIDPIDPKEIEETYFNHIGRCPRHQTGGLQKELFA